MTLPSRCKPGLKGDGQRCKECSVAEGPRCHPNAACFFDDQLYYYRCKCKEGFRGDGIQSCVGNQFDCRRCDRNAECVDRAYCRCKPGFRDVSGDGSVCTKGELIRSRFLVRSLVKLTIDSLKGRNGKYSIASYLCSISKARRQCRLVNIF